MELGALVRTHRTSKSLTQAQLAAQVGVSRKWIIDLEAGKRTAEISLVLRTLRALGLDLQTQDRASAPSASANIDTVVARSRRLRK